MPTAGPCSWLLAPFIFIIVSRAEQECHVCVSGFGAAEVESLFPGAPLPSCRHSSQIRLCPQGYRGCLTQTRGGEVTRTCAQLAVDACRPANGVEYCYCTGPLCNAPPASPPGTTDDEDLAEGSGLELEPPGADIEVPERTTTTTTTVAPSAPVNMTRSSSATGPLPAALGSIFTILLAVWR